MNVQHALIKNAFNKGVFYWTNNYSGLNNKALFSFRYLVSQLLSFKIANYKPHPLHFSNRL